MQFAKSIFTETREPGAMRKTEKAAALPNHLKTTGSFRGPRTGPCDQVTEEGSASSN